MSKKKVLGRGLLNLMPDTQNVSESDLKFVFPEILISDIKVNPDQPRKYFSKDELEELAESIKSIGVLQPVVVRSLENSLYELISGERRYRACKIAGFTKIPAVVKNISHKDSLKLSIIENIQREDLNPIELAEAYDRLKSEFSLNNTHLAQELGKNRATIINVMRLLYLPEKTKNYIRDKKITEGQARPLITPYKEKKLDQKVIDDITEEIIERKLTSRQVESLIKVLQKGQNLLSSKNIQKNPNKDTSVKDLEKKLSDKLMLKTEIKHNGISGKGKIIISYSDFQNMESILKTFGV